MMHIGRIVDECSIAQSNKVHQLLDAFRFSDLPGELRDDIYRRYFGTWDAVIAYDRKSASFKIDGVPLHDVMLANRTFHSESNHLIAESYSGRLVLRDTRVRRENGWGLRSSLEVLGLLPSWLLDGTDVLSIDRGTPGMLMALPLNKFKSLREIQLTGIAWPDAHAYPCGMSIVDQQIREKDVFEGKYDTWCVQGFDKWPLVPEMVSNGQIRIVTVKQGVVNGTYLEVRLEHKPTCVEVVARSINYIPEPKFPIDDSPAPSRRGSDICRPM